MYVLKERIQEEAPADGEATGGSLLDNSNPDTTDTGDANEWFYSDGIKGEGEKPEYFNSDKYKTLSDQAKAYPELASKLGAYTGAPESYELTLPEGMSDSIQIDPDNETTQEFLSYAKERGVSQEDMDKFVGFHASSIQEIMSDLIPNREAEMAQLGPDASKMLKNISDWGGANLDSDTYEMMKEVASTANGVKLVEALIGKTRNAPVPAEAGAPATGQTHDDVKAMRYAKDDNGHYKIETDPAYKKKVDDAYAGLFGNEPKMTVVQ